MKKKSAKSSKVKKRQKKSSLPANEVVIFTVFFSIIATLSLTFAWFTSSDKLANSFEGTQLIAEIDEVFNENPQWQPGETTTKEIRIKNTGKTSAFVRVSLYEFFVSFQVDVTDQTGNGNLKTVNAPIGPILDEQETNTWEASAKFHGTYTKASKHYVTESAIVSDPENKTGMYEYKGSERETTALKYISLNFSDAVKEIAPSIPIKNWVYEKGYFYYVLPLKPGEESEPLLKSVTLSPTAPNQYKGSLYKMKVYMDAHDQTKPLLDNWQLTKDSSVYQLLDRQLK